jgi:hypothetical protein
MKKGYYEIPSLKIAIKGYWCEPGNERKFDASLYNWLVLLYKQI